MVFVLGVITRDLGDQNGDSLRACLSALVPVGKGSFLGFVMSGSLPPILGGGIKRDANVAGHFGWDFPLKLLSRKLTYPLKINGFMSFQMVPFLRTC